METYEPVSLPPAGNYTFRAVIGNKLGNSSYNISTEFDVPEGEKYDLLYNYNNVVFFFSHSRPAK